MRAAGRSEEVLELRVIAVLLRELDKVALSRRHEREAAVRDVPDHSSVTSHRAGAREGQKSFAVDVGHNAPPYVIVQDGGGALIGLLGWLRDRGVDQRLRRGFRPLQRHSGGNPVKAAESGLVCMKREVDGKEVTVVGIWIVEEYTKGRRGRMALYNGKYRSRTDFSHRNFRNP